MLMVATKIATPAIHGLEPDTKSIPPITMIPLIALVTLINGVQGRSHIPDDHITHKARKNENRQLIKKFIFPLPTKCE